MSEQWVVRWGDRWPRQTAQQWQESAKTLEEAGKWPTEAEARERLDQTCWGEDAVVERIDAPKASVAKHDVDALLQEVDSWTVDAHERGVMRGPVAIMRNLAAALRAERERADRLDAEAMTARSLLGIILDRGWPPGTTGPSIVRRARAFLAGEEQVWRHDDAFFYSLDEIKRRIETALGFAILPDTPLHLVPGIVGDAVRKMAEANATLARKFEAERDAHAQTKRERDDALETIRVLRLRIGQIPDLMWRDLPK